MKRIHHYLSIWSITFLLLLTLVNAENRHPIVLVHGFLGWGPEEMNGYSYWGGLHDLEEHLESLGFTVFTVSIGPVSSNWERAIEVFYQIKGGQVDYGEDHSKAWGIIQKPEKKVYPGLYPEWDDEHPVHLIGHSMGGQTIRMLAYQLNRVIYADSSTGIRERGDLLGRENQNWITSITTIGTPHNGTTLTDIAKRSVSFLQYFVGLAAAAGSNFYDFDLQHWGLEREYNEPWLSYFRRVREHAAWNTKNFSAWDLSLDGARQLNTLVQMDPNIYYYSYPLYATRLDSATGYHIPDKGINLILQAKARLIGMKTAFWDDGTASDSTWFQNDGVVNTCSQYGPTSGLNGPEPIAEYRPDEPAIPGQWYIFGPINMDHWYVIGQSIMNAEERTNLYTIYSDHCKILWSLSP